MQLDSIQLHSLWSSLLSFHICLCKCLSRSILVTVNSVGVSYICVADVQDHKAELTVLILVQLMNQLSEVSLHHKADTHAQQRVSNRTHNTSSLAPVFYEWVCKSWNTETDTKYWPRGVVWRLWPQRHLSHCNIWQSKKRRGKSSFICTVLTGSYCNLMLKEYF